MRRLAVLLAGAARATSALAEPVFAPVSIPEHLYTGGWEHFVGGGVAAFDCDGDALPELVAAGETGPMTLLRNRGEMIFEAGAFPSVAGASGVYALDLDGDARTDLVVLRVGENVTLKGDGACGFAVHDFGLPGGEAWTTAFSE